MIFSSSDVPHFPSLCPTLTLTLFCPSSPSQTPYIVPLPAVSLLAVGLLLCNYAGAVYLGVARPDVFRAPVMVLGHLGLAAYLLLKTRELHRKEYNRSGIIGFYRNIWVCFYSEYFLWTFC